MLSSMRQNVILVVFLVPMTGSPDSPKMHNWAAFLLNLTMLISSPAYLMQYCFMLSVVVVVVVVIVVVIAFV